MKKIKVSEASEAVLDWLVENADLRGRLENTEQRASITNRNIRLRHEWSPSVNWAQGGPIIEREKIELIPPRDEDDPEWMAVWYKCEDAEAGIHVGTSPLLAAMRCYVASKLGDQVEVPDELV